MTGAPSYQRGNLREVLLSRALDVLRARGADALSLRELARDIGVSHAAPARHFADRRLLLDALALEGFALLAARIRTAIATAESPAAGARRAAETYLEFVTAEGNLAEVMFRHEPGRDADAIGRGAAEAFSPMLGLFPAERAADATATATLFLATLQGISALVNCGVLDDDQVPGLIDAAIPRFVGPHD